MSKTLLRQWETLRAIPRHPRKIDVSALRSMLDAKDLGTSRRSLQRDLIALSKVFPLDHDDGSVAHGWFWLPKAPAFDLPGMSTSAALILKIVDQHSPQLLPPALSAHLTDQDVTNCLSEDTRR